MYLSKYIFAVTVAILAAMAQAGAADTTAFSTKFTTTSTLTMTRYHYSSPTPANLGTTLPLRLGTVADETYVIFCKFSQIYSDFQMELYSNGAIASEYNIYSISFFAGGQSPRNVLGSALGFSMGAASVNSTAVAYYFDPYTAKEADFITSNQIPLIQGLGERTQFFYNPQANLITYYGELLTGYAVGERVSTLLSNFSNWFDSHPDYYFGFVVDYRKSTSDISLTDITISHYESKNVTGIVAITDVDTVPEYPLPDFASLMPDFNITGKVVTDAKSCIPQDQMEADRVVYACWADDAYAISAIPIPDLSNYTNVILSFSDSPVRGVNDGGNFIVLFGADSPTIGTATGVSGSYVFKVELTFTETTATLTYTSPRVTKYVILDDLLRRDVAYHYPLQITVTLNQTVRGYTVGLTLKDRLINIYGSKSTYYSDSITFEDGSITNFSANGDYLLFGTSHSQRTTHILYGVTMTGTPYEPMELQKYYITGDASKEPTDLVSGAYLGTAPGQVVSVFTKVDKTLKYSALSFNITTSQLTGFGNSITAFVGSSSPILAPGIVDGGFFVSLNSSVLGAKIYTCGVPKDGGEYLKEFYNDSSHLNAIASNGNFTVTLGYVVSTTNTSLPGHFYANIAGFDYVYYVPEGYAWPTEDLYMGIIYDSGNTAGGSTAGSVYVNNASVGILSGSGNMKYLYDARITTTSTKLTSQSPIISDIIDVDALDYTPELTFETSPGCFFDRYVWYNTTYSLFCTDTMASSPQTAMAFYKMADLDQYGSFSINFLLDFYPIANGSPLVLSFGLANATSSADAAFSITLNLNYDEGLVSLSYYSNGLGKINSDNANFSYTGTQGMYFNMRATRYAYHYDVFSALTKNYTTDDLSDIYAFVNISDKSIKGFNLNETAPYWSIGESGAAGNNLQFTSMNMTMSQKVLLPSSVDSSSTTSGSTTKEKSSTKNTSVAVIVGASVGGVVAAAAAAIVLVRRVGIANGTNAVGDGSMLYKDENPLYTPKYVTQENEIYVPSDVNLET